MSLHLDSFLELADALERLRSPMTGPSTLLRRVALALTPGLREGTADEVAKAHLAVTRNVRRGASPLTGLRGPFAHVVAALVDDVELRATEIGWTLEEIEQRFREVGLPRRGNASVLARALLLHEGARLGTGVVPSFARVRRVEAALKAMHRSHRFMTTREDLPLAVLLSVDEDEMDAALRGAEAGYGLLIGHGLGPRRALRTATQALAAGARSAEETENLAERLGALWCAGREQGLRMNRADWMAHVGLAWSVEIEESADAMREVVGMRQRIRGLRPSPRKQLGFELAAGLCALDRFEDSDRRASQVVPVLLGALQALAASQAHGASMAGSTVILASSS